MKRSFADSLGKKASKFYFELIPNQQDKYQCKICPKVQRIQKPSTGYSNLMNHITSAHPNYEEEIKKAKEGKIEGCFPINSFSCI